MNLKLTNNKAYKNTFFEVIIIISRCKKANHDQLNS